MRFLGPPSSPPAGLLGSPERRKFERSKLLAWLPSPNPGPGVISTGSFLGTKPLPAHRPGGALRCARAPLGAYSGGAFCLMAKAGRLSQRLRWGPHSPLPKLKSLGPAEPRRGLSISIRCSNLPPGLPPDWLKQPKIKRHQCLLHSGKWLKTGRFGNDRYRPGRRTQSFKTGALNPLRPPVRLVISITCPSSNALRQMAV